MVYKKEVAKANCLSEQVPTHMPRDLKQLQNLRFKHLNESRISRDDLYNLHEIAYDTTGFVHKIITYPDLACVCGLDQILKEADQISSSMKLDSYCHMTQLFSWEIFMSQHYSFVIQSLKRSHAFQ